MNIRPLSLGSAMSIVPDQVSTESFLRARSVESESGCWLTQTKRYACVRIDGRLFGLHRVAWVLTNGEVPDGLIICHRCNDKRCINPAHLYAGTHSDNNRDAWRDGCQPPVTPRGWRLQNAMKTHCKNGHELSGDNLTSDKRARACRTCQKNNDAKWKAKKRTEK